MKIFWSYHLFFKSNAIIFLGLVIFCLIGTTSLVGNGFLKSNYIDEQIDEFGTIKLRVSDISLAPVTETFYSLIDRYNLAPFLEDEVFLSHSWNIEYGSIDNLNRPDNETSRFFSGIGGVNHSLLEELSQLAPFTGRLPQNSGEIILLTSPHTNYNENFFPWSHQVELGDIINITLQNISPPITRQLRVVGIYKTATDSTEFDHSDEVFSERKYDFSDPFLVENPLISSFSMNLSSFHDLLANDTGREFQNENYLFTLSIKNRVDFRSLPKFVNDFNDFSRNLRLSKTIWVGRYINIKYLGVQTSSIDRFELLQSTSGIDLYEFDEVLRQIQLLNFWQYLILIPSFLLVISFIYFSSQIFDTNLSREYKLLQIRGIPYKTIIRDILLQNFLLSVIGLLIGVIIGLVIGFMMFGDLSFTDLEKDFIIIGNTINELTVLIIFFIFISFIIIANSVFSVKKAGDLENTTNKILARPFWKRYNIDIIFFILGITGNIFTYLFIFNQDFFFGGELFQSDIGLMILLIFGIISIPFPIIIFIGGLGVSTRIFSFLLTKISKKLWVRQGNLLAYVMYVLSRRKVYVTRTLLVYILIFSVLVSFITIPASLGLQNSRSSYYKIGADAYFDHKWNNSLELDLNNNINIESYTQIGFSTLRFSQDENTNTNFNVLVIKPDFVDAAYFEDSHPLYSKIDKLFTTPNTIFVNALFLDHFRLKVNDFLSFFPQTVLTSEDTATLQIQETYQYWPRISTSFRGYSMVMSFITFNGLKEKNISITDLSPGYYLKLVGNYDLDDMRSTLSVSNIEFAIEELKKTEDFIVNRMFDRQLLLLFPYVLLIQLMLSLLLIYFQHRSKTKENLIHNTLGITNNQLIRSFFYQTSLLSIFSAIFGLALSFIFTSSLVSVLFFVNAPNSIPTPIYLFPILEILVAFISIILVGIIIGLIATFWRYKRSEVEISRII